MGDERTITVYLPPHYYDEPEVEYTVTYVLDGHFAPFINLGVQSIEYPCYMEKITQTIVVGIHAKQRGWEFSAPDPGEEPDEEEHYQGPRAPELQQHFKKEVFPLIDSLYPRTLPFRTLVGHSSGGGFVLYTLFGEGRALFDAYIGISPALRESEQAVLGNAERLLQAGTKFPKFLYCSTGTVGDREFLFGRSLDKLDALLKQYPESGLIWRRNTFEGMDHFTCVGPSFNGGMVELTRAFRADTKTIFDFAANSAPLALQLDAFYAEQKKAYGFIDVPSAGYLFRVALDLEAREKLKAAGELYDWATAKHPDNYRLSRKRGNFYFRHNPPAAVEAYGATMELLERQKAELDASVYEDRKVWLEERMKEVEQAVKDKK